ncbi:hypothetical protein OMO38_12950 [Chryseobacterium sp. 09-1422]|uniref:AsmA-like C-terminal domain-containing protein n=1 Tax=Chryseobacterium kimseyorum TaxID=2984028 RepID=A0ABT3I048_9FLAO|nr:hypothetical protein [Chryseobacterium kimseyorum]MCW3169429.1 hypothetical protein [Chryseobacterium kimseyorum]
MKKPWVRKLLIGLGIFFGLILIANLAINIWLKTQLPDYIKKNTDYQISYKSLGVDLGTGNIFATGITVNNKNPQNVNVMGFQGTIDTLKVSRFGIYDAVFNKTISTSDIYLAKPNLNIVLAKPKDKKKDKKTNPVSFENIRINNGTIQVFKHTKQKLLGVNDLDLMVENLQLTEDTVENKLPVTFDHYSIKGKDIFFQPDEIYTLKVQKITTANGQVSVNNLHLAPIIDFDNFKKTYPKKKQLITASIQKIDFRDVVLKDNTVSLTNASFQNPNILIYTTDAIPDKVKKPLNFELNLGNFKLNNALIQVNKPDGNKMLFAKDVNLNIKNIEFNKETSAEMIPLRYKDFSFSGKDIQFSNHQDMNIGTFSLSPKKGDIRNISVIPKQVGSGKTTMNLTANQIVFNINKWEIVDKKLNLDVKDVLVNQVNGTVTAGTIKSTKKSNFNGIQFPVLVRNVTLKNSNLTYDSKNQPLQFQNLNATIKDIELTEKPKNGGLAVKVKDYNLTTRNFAYRTKFYNMTVAALSVGKNKIKLDQFAMKPLVSRAQFIRMIPVESDLYDLKANQVNVVGEWDFFSDNQFLHATNVSVLSANANIFRSKIPADDPKEKLLYSRLLRTIKLPMFIDQLQLKNSVLEYEEDTPKSSGPGKLTFTNFNMNVKNLNSAKMKGKPTQVDIKINCTFMETSLLSVNWGFNTADQSDRFTIAGKLNNIPAVALNAFVVPYMSVTATGTIQEMLFNFKGNPKGIGGTFNIKHKDLKVSILDKDSKKKKGVLSAVVNIFVKSDSGKFPESVVVEDVERDPTKSFFNLFWKGIEDGLKKTLIGIDVDKTKKTVEKTKEAVRDVKTTVNEAKASVKEAEKDISKAVSSDQKSPAEKPKEKKGIFRKVFNKKENPETK